MSEALHEEYAAAQTALREARAAEQAAEAAWSAALVHAAELDAPRQQAIRERRYAEGVVERVRERVEAAAFQGRLVGQGLL
jgi:hypothetical protein